MLVTWHSRASADGCAWRGGLGTVSPAERRTCTEMGVREASGPGGPAVATIRGPCSPRAAAGPSQRHRGCDFAGRHTSLPAIPRVSLCLALREPGLTAGEGAGRVAQMGFAS